MTQLYSEENAGNQMYKWASDLFPIARSITGNGVRTTLSYFKNNVIPNITVHEVPSGTKVFDWTIPDEWNVREAWIEGPDGARVVDFANHSLHLVGYSISVDISISLEVLQDHLHSLPDQPDAIPYVTSYYFPRWGFCMRHRDRLKLKTGMYRVHIDVTLAPGSLTFGELIIPGESEKEVFLSTYICHPSMANNELSGPCVTACLAKWLYMIPRRYTYRIVFVPETIGSITYLSRNLDYLKQHVIAGYNITCIGDDRNYSYLPSRNGNTLSDRIALHVLKYLAPQFKRYTFLDRGSDERQYCAPGVDLPVATIMRSKYGEYPEYHTSLDDLTLVTNKGLEGGFLALKKAIEMIEADCIPQVTVLCEPQLGRRGLYRSLSIKPVDEVTQVMLNLIAYSDGKHSLFEIAEIIEKPMWELVQVIQQLTKIGLIDANYP